MDSKKLAKVIKALVSAEIKRQLPILVEQEVSRRMKPLLNEIKKSKKEPVQEETDMFSLASQVLRESRNEGITEGITEGTKLSMLSMLDDEDEVASAPLSKNPMIDKILKQTQPFSPAQRVAGPVGFEQRFQQPINESVGDTGYEEWPTMGGGAIDSSQFNMAPTPATPLPQDIRAQMAAKMGYGDMASGPSKQGMGVTTGLPGLDRILNRDNSALIKAWDKKK